MYTMSEIADTATLGKIHGLSPAQHFQKLLRKSEALQRNTIPTTCGAALLNLYGHAVELRTLLRSAAMALATPLARSKALEDKRYRAAMAFPEKVRKRVR